ncbi:MAG: N-acetyltransferase [Rhodanobacteraceae bacterium]|nr:N-acetyltransferase [Rhodanobacteraceae bacterium]
MSSHSSRRPPERLRFDAANDTPRLSGDNLVSRDGTPLSIRPIHANDVAALQRGFTHLHSDEVRMRFLHTLSELSDPLAQRLCRLDPEQELAFVLTDPPDTGDEPEIYGVARAYVDPNTDSAEFALIVQRRFTGQGFGSELLNRVIESCRARGVTEIWGDVLTENRTMLDLCEEFGFRRESVFHDASLTRVRLSI